MITNLKSFLESAKPEGWTRRTMPYEKSSFMQAINHLPYEFRSKPTAIWRGMPNTKSPYVYITGSDGRPSANTTNYYTLWMDNRPDWVGFPKRSKSTICSTSAIRAQGYAKSSGLVYGILPLKNDRHIAVCEKYDIWEEFEIKISDIPDVIRDEIVHYVFEIPFDDESMRHIQLSKFYDEYITAPVMNKVLSGMNISDTSYEEMIASIEKTYPGLKVKAITDTLDKLINTDSIRLYTYEELSELTKDTSTYEGGQELWFEGDSVGISIYEMDDLTEVPEGVWKNKYAPMGGFNWAETPMEKFL